jgi:ribose transport system substrate-binding protein
VKLASHNAIIEGNPYRVRYEADIQEAAAAAVKSGFDVKYASFVSNWDASVEAQQIQNSINEGYDIILVNPVSPTGMDPLIERAQDAGILYINADCIYTSPEVDILNVATDQYYLGYKTATYAGEVLGRGAKVVMLAAMEGVQANTDRQAGFQKGVEEQGLVVVATANHDWNPMLTQRVMTEILNSGVQFDGVLVSQTAENALSAFDATGTPYPKFLGFNDTGEWMQRMIQLNKDKRVMDFLVLSNPPGVGGSALNFGLNIMLGKELRDDIYDDPSIHSILLPSKVTFTYDTMGEYEAMAMAMAPGDAITYWYTIDEVAAQFFK